MMLKRVEIQRVKEVVAVLTPPIKAEGKGGRVCERDREREGEGERAHAERHIKIECKQRVGERQTESRTGPLSIVLMDNESTRSYAGAGRGT